MLWHLLNIDPSERITAEAALVHSFFDSIREKDDVRYFDYGIVPLAVTYAGEISVDHMSYYA